MLRSRSWMQPISLLPRAEKTLTRSDSERAPSGLDEPNFSYCAPAHDPVVSGVVALLSAIVGRKFRSTVH
jgi:hypothetical protein